MFEGGKPAVVGVIAVMSLGVRIFRHRVYAHPTEGVDISKAPFVVFLEAIQDGTIVLRIRIAH